MEAYLLGISVNSGPPSLSSRHDLMRGDLSGLQPVDGLHSGPKG